MSTDPGRTQDADQAPAPALDEQLDAVRRTVAALREDGPPPQHITVRAADVMVELSWAGPAPVARAVRPTAGRPGTRRCIAICYGRGRPGPGRG